LTAGNAGAPRLTTRHTARASSFSAVDDSPDPAGLVAYLDRAAFGLGAMKRYMATSPVRVAPGGLVLDVGCGAGHDLELLRESGFHPVGLDPSAVMLAESGRRLPGIPLVRGAGERLPFRDGSLDGCRLERVLIHVADPAMVLAEVARVVRRGGFVAVFEPDWTSLTIDGDDASVARGLARSRSSVVGGGLEALVEEVGFKVLDVVTEDSRGYTMARVPRDLDVEVRRELPPDEAEAWLATQRSREAAGTFRARWIKTLVVAMRR
jgi:ubiquinone/menaquinone biosynthesis C-methylase UbiE